MPSWSPFAPPKPRVSKLKAKPAKPVGTTAAKTPVVNDLPPHPAADTPAPHIMTSKPRKQVAAYGGGKAKPTVKKAGGDPVEALLAQLVKGSGVNARQTVQNQLAPFMAQFQAGLRQQTTSEAQRRAALQGFTASLMKVLQGDVAGVQQDYANAESQIGALSSAASQSFAAQNPNAQDQALLQSVNAPAGQQAALAGQNQSLFGQGANTLAYLGGTLPRENLTQAGLAQLAYTRGLPGIAALSGEQAFKQQLQAFSTERQKLQDQRASVLAQIPGLVQKVQASNQAQRAAAINSLLGYKSRQQTLAQQREFAILGQRSKDRALDLEAAGLGLKQNQQTFDNSVAVAKLKLSDRKLGLEGARLKLQAARDDNNTQLALSRLGISDRSQQLRELEFEWKMKHPAQKGGFTASQKSKLRGTATTIAEQAFRGFTGTPDPAHPDGKFLPLSYDDALLEMQKEGVPMSLALPALTRFYGTTAQRQQTAKIWRIITRPF